MRDGKFEAVLGYHCAPSLMGVKPANLVSFSKREMPTLPEKLEEYRRELARRGVCTEVVCACRSHYLVLVYRPILLASCLRAERTRFLLGEQGYREDWSLTQMFSHLRERFEGEEGLPHEIGLFLGYPPEDVQAFCARKGEDCKLCGYWKVYGDVEAAKKTFALYDRCRSGIASMQKKGRSILQAMDEARQGLGLCE